PDEDAYVLSRYARSVLGTDDVDFRTRRAGPDEDDALATAASRVGARYDDVEAAPLVLLVGLDPEEEVPILYLRLRKAWLKRGTKLVSLGPRAGTISELLWRWLPSAVGGEAAALRSLTDGGDGEVGDVAAALRDAGPGAVILVGERAAASPGALATAGRLAASTGAKLSWVPRRNNARGALSAGLLPGLLPGGRRLHDSGERAEVEQLWGAVPESRGRRLHAILEAAANGDVDVLHLVGVDLARDCDLPRLARAALERVPTVIVQDLLDTETVRYADVVLPAAAAQERAGTFTNWEGRRQRFGLAVDAPRLAQEDWDILSQLAARLGHDLGYASLDDIRREMAALPPVAERDWPESGPTGAPGTESGDGDGLQLLSYPLLLDRGVLSIGADDMLSTAKAPFAALHPDDAARLGIADAQPVLVASESGRLEVTAVVDEHQVPGVVFVPSNSTDAPAATLAAGDGGPVRVSVESAPGAAR
ncbi:MAG: molybdopterin-dependent oxidoreductase, partial [Nitriliruptorales bacterium]